MATRFYRRKTLLVKMEATYALDPTPVVGTNAVLIRNVKITPFQGDYVDRPVIHNYLGHDEQLIVGQTVKLSGEIEIAGSGTPGVVPAWGPILRACGFSELALAAAHADTAQAGGASTITLAAGTASAADEAYRGLRIDTTGGTGPGQHRTISTYNGTTKVATVSQAWAVPPDATTTYSIGAQVAYLPISSGMESVYAYFNMDGKLHKLAGVRGTLDIKMSPKSIPVFSINMMGLYVAPTDTAQANVTLTPWKTPLGVNNTNTSGFDLHGYSAVLYDLSLTLGNKTVHRNVVGQEDILLTDRAPTGKIIIEDPTLATKNYFTAVTSIALDAMNLTHGTAAGNIVRLHAPTVPVTNPDFTDQDGVIGLSLDARLKPNLGNDELVIQAA